jgi:alkylation response protein AidB-like acyl-CoA dehydrogenase
MRTPGIEVRPIISIAGLHHLNEVFFTDVKVPVQNLIGEENKGWTYAKYLLVQERTSIGGVPESKKKAAHIKMIARAERNADGGALMDDPAFQRKLAEIEVKLTSLEYMNLRILADAAAGKAVGPESSLLKIVGSEVQQALGELAVEAVGYYIEPFGQGALPDGANARDVSPAHARNVWADYGYGRAASIYGGSNEIQHDVIAKAILNL